MAKTSKAFRERMQKRKQSMARKGVVIDKKDWTKGRIRLLPCHGEDPAKEFMSFYCQEMRKSCTAPRTWGVDDPLWDRLDEIYKTGDKADKEHAKDYISRSVEYWAPCIVRGDEGTAANPNVRIFRLPQKVYQYIVDLIIDEDYGEDVTDADEGRDILVKKEGKGIKTEWKPDKMDQCVIVEDDDLYEKLVEISHKFDPANNFFSFDLDDYRQMYEGLTGEELPDDCIESLTALAEGETGADETGEEEEYEEEEDEESEEEEDDESDEEEDEGDDEEAAEGEEEEEESDEDDMLADPPEGIEFGKTVVSFETDDGTAQGVVQSWAEDDENEGEFVLAIVGDDDDEDDPWLLSPEEVEIVEVEDEADAEEEEEAEEAEPTVSRGKKKMPRRPSGGAAKQIRSGKKTTKKAPAKSKATTKKTTKKAPAKSKAITKKTTTRKAPASKKTTTRKAPASKKAAKKTTKKASRRGGR